MAGARRRASRLIAALIAPAALLGGAGLMASPAVAAPGDQADQTVTSGDARFQVLSPTLIRTEFAGDGDFTDEATFNAIGRADFGPADFTSTTVDGWLTIATDEMTVRYLEGSGDFTPQNLQVTLTTDSGQQVTGSPWEAAEVAPCATGVLCEAEALSLEGLALATNHSGATGEGFAAGFESVGNALNFRTTVGDGTTDGDLDLTLRYANSQGGDGQVTTRTLTVTVDGGDAQTIQLPATAGWDSWSLASTGLALTPGTHDVRIERTAADSGQVNLDSLALVAPGAAYPAPSTEPVVADCAFGTICEAETGTLTGGAATASDHNGASGDRFLAGLRQGASQTTHVTGVPVDGAYALQVRYASGQAADRTIEVRSGAGDPVSAALAPTSGWDYWRTVSVPVQLTAGENDVTIECPDAASCELNVDTVAVAAADAPMLAPHAALGGYRRDLDTANGTVDTNPGLLYQDGWALLDDTASSLYVPDSQTITERGDHGGEAYQDGYVFGYGDDYLTGLADLKTLTGPTALLPRWAYGVWYSEYYDRSQSDFTDTIVPAFRENGVPVDVMAIDTDYKSPDKWNGWEVDTSRFPDMAGLLAELEAQGIHNTLNVHPTIGSNDPKFAEAQATANNALTKGGGDDYLFDWADPAQLQAYFDLHDDTQAAGTDIWWLDWCCSEGSQYSAPGVTPDAFINQQYANYTDDALGGRGFAFSRAYGSLTAGGYGNPQPVETGPWADKRTTLHFTGDTVSTWQMLQAEVGYTPGESAATGLAAISHDIGGHTGGTTFPGAEPESTKLADDLYARWVQLGTFQPIDRLHSNHSDRLPWQYGPAADASATSFLNLRENLVPYTYSIAAEATATGAPMTRPIYLEYPGSEEAYAMAGREYLYGSDVLVAPVTTPGDTATTTVWFPEGSQWVDWFTGETHEGGSTADVTTGLDRMPVFVKAGGIVPTRSANVFNDSTSPLDAVTLTVAGGSDGTFSLYEDDGGSAADVQSATTAIAYSQQATGGTLTIDPASGTFDGQVADRSWTATFRDADAPAVVTIDGAAVDATAWSYDAASRTLTVPVASRPVAQATTVSFSTQAAAVPAISVDQPSVTAGGSQTVRGTGFPALSAVVLTTSPDLGTTAATTDAAGSFTATLSVPASADGGSVTVTASSGTATASVSFSVLAASGPGGGTPQPGEPTATPTPTPGGGSAGGSTGAGSSSNSGDLASTGSAAALIAAGAAVLLALGGVLLYRRRTHSA
jgi:LPXTG-motif cell wall-anchored protein